MAQTLFCVVRFSLLLLFFYCLSNWSMRDFSFKNSFLIRQAFSLTMLPILPLFKFPWCDLFCGFRVQSQILILYPKISVGDERLAMLLHETLTLMQQRTKFKNSSYATIVERLFQTYSHDCFLSTWIFGLGLVEVGGGVYARIYLKIPFLPEKILFIYKHSREVF